MQKLREVFIEKFTNNSELLLFHCSILKSGFCYLVFTLLGNQLLRVNMSDSPRRSSDDFAKKVQRQLNRSKEMVTVLHDVFPWCCTTQTLWLLSLLLLLLQVLQKLGKTVETRDNQFDCCLQQFLDQQVIRCVTDGKQTAAVWSLQ